MDTTSLPLIFTSTSVSISKPLDHRHSRSIGKHQRPKFTGELGDEETTGLMISVFYTARLSTWEIVVVCSSWCKDLRDSEGSRTSRRQRIPGYTIPGVWNPVLTIVKKYYILFSVLFGQALTCDCLLSLFQLHRDQERSN